MTKRAVLGTVLQLSIATVFTTVAHCKKIDYPDDETQFQDLTDTESTAVEDGVVNGLRTPGTCSFDLWYDPLDTVHKAVIAAKVSKSTESWKITNPNIGSGTAHACTFSGVVKKFRPTASAGAFIEAAGEIKLTTPCSYSNAANS